MKALAVALPLTLAAGVFIGVHAATPWFSPRVDDLVQIAGSTGPVATGGSVTIATVPSNCHFVASQAETELISGNNYGWNLVERDSTGAEFVRVPRGVFQRTVVGLNSTVPGEGVVFGPGSEVVLKYLNPGGSGLGEIDYLLLGHYRAR